MVPVLTAHTDCFDFSTLTDTIVKLTSTLLHRASPGSSPTFPSINDKLANNNVYSLIRSFLISTDSINSKNVRSEICYLPSNIKSRTIWSGIVCSFQGNQNLIRSSMYLRISLIGTRSCCMVSRSRMVTVWVSSVSKSTQMLKGVPISS